jgi:quercetin dioxygenase-like cupin family protein
VIPGRMADNAVTGAHSLLFEETPPHSSLDWHRAPTTQYVITLTGVLEFTTRGGETFTIHPGDILVALDTTGTGHKWRLTNDQPWVRAYVAFTEHDEINFKADSQ